MHAFKFLIRFGRFLFKLDGQTAAFSGKGQLVLLDLLDVVGSSELGGKEFELCFLLTLRFLGRAYLFENAQPLDGLQLW